MSHSERTSFVTRQPGKAIWSILALLYGTARLPFWLIFLIPRSLRPDSRWTWGQAVRMRMFTAFLQWASDVKVTTPLDLSPGAEREQWVNLEPAESRYFTGVATADPQVKPAKSGGTWYPSASGTHEKGKKVVLHFHGGAFAIGDGRKADTEFLAKTLLKHAGVSYLFIPNYRLSSNKGNHFPAALQDAITSYVYLLNQKDISPSDIVFSGDSAGGNLVLALLRYIADNKQVSLPTPSCAWLWSPWVDPVASVTGKSQFYDNPNTGTDYLSPDFGPWGASGYTLDGSTGITNDHKYVNFIVNTFKTDTPLYYSICEKEVLYFDAKASYDAFSKVPGNKTELSIEPAAPHDIILVGYLAGFEREAADSAKKAGKFLSSL